MRHLHVAETRGVYPATLRDTTPPVPRSGEVLVRVAASGLNRADLSQIAGRYPPPPGESEILGMEVSGVVESTGARVCALLAGGGHAEQVAVPAGHFGPVPAGTGPGKGPRVPAAVPAAFGELRGGTGPEGGGQG